jgi:hypothetical protein
MSANVSKAPTVFSRVELEAVAYSEALVIIYKSTRISFPEDRNLDTIKKNSGSDTHKFAIFFSFLSNAVLQISKCSIEQHGHNVIPGLQVERLRRTEIYTQHHPSYPDTWTCNKQIIF